MTILVLNANGNVGSAVAAQLLAKGEAIRIGARDVARAKARFPNAEIVAFDFSKPDTLKAAMKGVSAVFTAAPFELLPQAEFDVLAAAKAAGVATIVKMSALGADSANPHSMVEEAIKASGLAYTFLKPTFLMQNYTTISAATIKDHGAFYEPADEGKTSFIDARDIAAIAVKAMTEAGHHGKAYALTGAEALDRKAVAAHISVAIGKPVTFVNVDDAALRASMAGAPTQMVELMSALMGYVRAGYLGGIETDVENVLGRKPTSFAQFAKDHAEVWKA
jgi:uncharacterized protein YbjT (DUF2867 family)